MRHCLIHLVLLFPVVWTDEWANLGFDLDTSADTYFSDDSLLTSMETPEWSERDDDWSADLEMNPDLFVDASSNQECQSDADQLQMTTFSRQFRRRDLCPNNLFRTQPSSQDAAVRKFLESIPIFELYSYKEPDPNICPDEFLGHFIYPICGSGEEDPLAADGVNISPCNPCTLAVHAEKNVS